MQSCHGPWLPWSCTDGGMIMNVGVDVSKCQGYGNCALAAPDVFDVDESGTVVLLVDAIPADREADVKQAVRECPTGALTIEE
jgi:ferredoxin